MQTWANDRGKQLSVSGQAEMKIHFMNIGFNYEEPLCCGSFFNVRVHESFNMGCLSEMVGKKVQKRRRASLFLTETSNALIMFMLLGWLKQEKK